MRALLLTVAVACLPVACTSSPSGAPAPDAGPSPVEADASGPRGNIDCAGASRGDTLTILHQWKGQEQERFRAILKPLVDACGLAIDDRNASQAALGEAAAAGTLDVGSFGPAELAIYESKLVTMETLGAHRENYADFFVAPGTVRGRWIGVPVKADVKSLIWYSPRVFAAKGYAVPKTWDALGALVAKMVAQGDVPWSMGFESESATGWAGTDFIQDVLLVTEGPTFVLDILSGKVPYNHASVRKAYETYGAWAKDPKLTVGGAEGTLKTPFLEAIYKVFATPPEAMMVKQSGFAAGEIEKKFPGSAYGTDYDFFFVPGARGLQGGTDWMMAFRDTRAVRALIGYLTSSRGGASWARNGLDLSPNRGAAGNYPDAALSKKGEALSATQGFTLDIGDAMPGDFKLTEWKAVVDYVGGADLDAALAAVAKAQADALR